jgi:DNA-damage-inducible protein D
MSEHDDDQDQGQDQGGAILPFDDGTAGRLIRRQWHEDRWYFSVVDVVAVLTDSPNPRRYWADLKRRVADEGYRELYAKCVQLKMLSNDRKRYVTDAADVETMLRIVQSIPSPKAEPIKQWLAEVGTERLEELSALPSALPIDPAELSEAQRRIVLRDEVSARNKDLAATAQGAGVLSPRDFAVFQDHGYRGLYDGETARDIAARKGLRSRQHILDHMSSEELAANWFRVTQTEAKIQREGILGKAEANATHFAVGKKVRETIADLGGTMPEELPTPPLSVDQLRKIEARRRQAELQAQAQPSLFPAQPEATGEDGGH